MQSLMSASVAPQRIAAVAINIIPKLSILSFYITSDSFVVVVLAIVFSFKIIGPIMLPWGTLLSTGSDSRELFSMHSKTCYPMLIKKQLISILKYAHVNKRYGSVPKGIVRFCSDLK